MQRVRTRERAGLTQDWSHGDDQAWLALLKSISAGDRDALASLYARFQRPLFRYLCQLTPDRGLAEEILQDTFVAIWRNAASFEERSSVRTWIFGVARRQAHNTLRKHNIQLASEEALNDIPDPEPSLEDQVLSHVDLEELAEAISTLAPIYKEVLVLNFVHGLPYGEIAEIIGVPEGTVKSRLSNARRMLRELLRR